MSFALRLGPLIRGYQPDPGKRLVASYAYLPGGIAVCNAPMPINSVNGKLPDIQKGIGSSGVGGFGKWKTGYDGGTGLACDKASCVLGTSFTLIAVFDGSKTGSVVTPILGGDDSGNRQFQFRLTASNTLEFIRFNTSGTNYSVSVAAASRRGVFIARSNGNSFDCFANGIKSSSGTIAAGSPQPVTKIAANGKFSFDAAPQIGDEIYAYVGIPRVLSLPEVMGISINPWSVFAP